MNSNTTLSKSNNTLTTETSVSRVNKETNNNMRYFKTMIVAVAFLGMFTATAQDDKTNELIKDAEKAKTDLVSKNESLATFFENSAGYVIFPNVGKGGLIIGGASGNGIVYEEGNVIGKSNLKKLNIGFQAGGQAVVEVIFFETKTDLERFKEDDFQFAAETSAVAVKSGIAFNAKYKDGVAVFAMPKAGLMADASVGGQRFEFTSFE